MQVFTVTYKLEVSQFAESQLATIIIDSQMVRVIRATSFSYWWFFQLSIQAFYLDREKSFQIRVPPLKYRV